jgi:pyruvate-formate lyase
MLWERYKTDKPYLDLYAEPHFAPASGIVDNEILCREIARIAESLEDVQPRPVIKARICEFILDHCAVDVNPRCWFGVTFGGWIPKYKKGDNNAVKQAFNRWDKTIPRTDAERAAFENYTASGLSDHFVDFAHWVPDWDVVMQYGFPGLLRRALRYRQEHGMNGGLSAGQAAYYDGIEIMYRAIIRFVGRLAECAQDRLACDERMPLRLDCLRQLAAGEPRNTYEALQLIYLFHLIQQYIECIQTRSLGDLDRLIYPYYLSDLHRGTFTREQVKEMFMYFFTMYDYQEHHYNQPMSIGGTDIFGQTAINDLTHVIVDAYFDADICNLKIHVFVGDNTPEAFLNKTMDMIRRGRGSFVFMNQDVGVRAMARAYDHPVEPYMLGSQGCYNFNIKGHAQHCNHARINLSKMIEFAFNQGVDPLSGYKVGADTPPVEAMQSYEDFHQACFAQLDFIIQKALTICDFYDRHILEYWPTPMQDATFRYSLEKAEGCFAYGTTSILCMSVGTMADCLMMVKKHVFEQADVTLQELRRILLDDWRGQEKLRMLLYQDPEKYGNNLDRPDALAREITDHCIRRITNRPNHRHGKFVVHFETIDRCFRSGKMTGATPDGRHSRTPIAKNLNAAFGQDRQGITAMMLSAAKIDVVDAPIGAPIDFMLHSSATAGEEGLNAMVGLLRTFLKLGGYALQGNVLDAETLKDAQAHPEKYPSLQVRVSGWNWYFINMEKEYQDTFIAQAEAL